MRGSEHQVENLPEVIGLSAVGYWLIVWVGSAYIQVGWLFLSTVLCSGMFCYVPCSAIIKVWNHFLVINNIRKGTESKLKCLWFFVQVCCYEFSNLCWPSNALSRSKQRKKNLDQRGCDKTENFPKPRSRQNDVTEVDSSIPNGVGLAFGQPYSFDQPVQWVPL